MSKSRMEFWLFSVPSPPANDTKAVVLTCSSTPEPEALLGMNARQELDSGLSPYVRFYAKRITGKPLFGCCSVVATANPYDWRARAELLSSRKALEISGPAGKRALTARLGRWRHHSTCAAPFQLEFERSAGRNQPGNRRFSNSEAKVSQT